MNAMKQAAWLFLGFISLAIGLWFFHSSAREKPIRAQLSPTAPDALISQLTFAQYDAQGNLNYFLKTPLLSHTPANNESWLKTPFVFLAEANHPAWTIEAQEAFANQGAQAITFNRSVVVEQQSESTAEKSRLQTETLTYFPKTKIAKTAAEVRFEQPGSTVYSKGFIAFLAEKRVKLLSKARGIYVPKQG